MQTNEQPGVSRNPKKLSETLSKIPRLVKIHWELEEFLESIGKKIPERIPKASFINLQIKKIFF